LLIRVMGLIPVMGLLNRMVGFDGGWTRRWKPRSRSRSGSGGREAGVVVLAFHLRQPDGEGRPLSRLGPHGHLATVVGHHVLDDAEAQAGAARMPGARSVNPVEALEDAFLVLGSQALALVRH
jgi:hypothetical protein